MRQVLPGIIIFFSLISSSPLTAQLTHDSLNVVYEESLSASLLPADSARDFETFSRVFFKKVLDDNSISDVEILEALSFAAKLEKLNKQDDATGFLKNVAAVVDDKPVYEAFVHFKLGSYYFNQQKPVHSLEHLMKAALLYEKLNLIQPLARTYLYISMINFMGYNENTGLNYASLGLDLIKNYKLSNRADSNVVRGLYSAKGLLQRRLGDFENALDNIEKSISFSEAMNDSVLVAISNGNKAIIYYEMGEMESALPLLQQDFEASMGAEIYFSAFNAGLYICKIYLALENYEALQRSFEGISNLYEQNKITNETAKAKYYVLGAEMAEMAGDKAKANFYLKKYLEADQKIDSLAKANDVAQLQEKYVLEREMTKLELLQKTNELQSSHLKLRTAIIVIIAVALIIVLVYLLVLRDKNRKIDRLNELLEAKVSERTNKLMEINKELDTYLYRASHDIRRPIRTLLGLNNVAKISDDKLELEKLFEKVHFTALNMDKMLFKLQMAYELNNDHEIETVNILKVLEDCQKDMAIEIASYNAKIEIDIAENAACVQANVALIRIVLENMIENAILYQNHGQPEISIRTDIGKYYFYIHVKDNGYGIEEEYYEKIFDPYFKISNKTQGSGLGLFLALRAVSFLAGEITVQSVINEGSHFTVKIPVNPK